MKQLNFFMIIISVLFSNAILAGEQPVFFESFSKMTWAYIEANGAKEIALANYDNVFDNPGWTGNKMWYGYKRATEEELFVEFNEVAFPRFGNTKTDSYLITPTLNLIDPVGVTVKFKVKSFIRKGAGDVPEIENSNMKVEYAPDGINFTTVYTVNDMDGVFQEKAFSIHAEQTTANAKLKFNRETAAANNRFFITDILIERGVLTNLSEVQSSNYKVYATQNGIVIKTDKMVNVEIFSLVGVQTKNFVATEGSNYMPILKGAYIVCIDGNSTKIIVP